MMLFLYLSMSVLPFLGFASAADSTAKKSEGGKRPHPEAAKLVLDLVAKQQSKTFQSNWGYSKAEEAAKVNGLIGSTIKGVKLTGPGPIIAAKKALQLVGGNQRDVYLKNMQGRADHLNEARRIKGMLPLGVPGTPLSWFGPEVAKHYSQLMDMQSYQEGKAKTTWEDARNAGTTNRVIASTIKGVKTTHKPRYNDFRRWGYENPSPKRLSRVTPSSSRWRSMSHGWTFGWGAVTPRSSRTYSSWKTGEESRIIREHSRKYAKSPDHSQSLGGFSSRSSLSSQYGNGGKSGRSARSSRTIRSPERSKSQRQTGSKGSRIPKVPTRGSRPSPSRQAKSVISRLPKATESKQSSRKKQAGKVSKGPVRPPRGKQPGKRPPWRPKV